MNITIPILAAVVSIILHVILAKMVPPVIKSKNSTLQSIKNVLVNDGKEIIVTSVITGVIVFAAIMIAEKVEPKLPQEIKDLLN